MHKSDYYFYMIDKNDIELIGTANHHTRPLRTNPDEAAKTEIVDYDPSQWLIIRAGAPNERIIIGVRADMTKSIGDPYVDENGDRTSIRLKTYYKNIDVKLPIGAGQAFRLRDICNEGKPGEYDLNGDISWFRYFQNNMHPVVISSDAYLNNYETICTTRLSLAYARDIPDKISHGKRNGNTECLVIASEKIPWQDTLKYLTDLAVTHDISDIFKDVRNFWIWLSKAPGAPANFAEALSQIANAALDRYGSISSMPSNCSIYEPDPDFDIKNIISST